MTKYLSNDHEGLNFQYGSVGEKIYDPNRRAWINTRISRHENNLKWLGDAETINAPFVDRITHRNQAVDTSKLRVIAELTGSYPELQPAGGLLSQAVRYADINATSQDNAFLNSDNLLGFGYASGLNKRTNRADSRKANLFPIVAMPGGMNHEILCLREMRYCRQGWNDDKGSWFTSYEINDTETSTWQGSHESIQQLLFAEPVEDTVTNLAVMYSTSITVFAPMGRDIISSKDTSRIDPNPICILGLEDIPGPIFTSVAFNPWYQHQMATVDGNGGWKIWSIEHSKKSRQWSYHAKIHARGVLDAALLNEKNKITSSEIKWFKVVWIGDLNTVAICSRAAIELIEFNSKSAVPKCITFNKGRPSTVILDMKKRSSKEDELFVLTSEQVIWCYVDTADSFGQQEKSPRQFRIISSWDHHRSGHDESIRLTLRENQDGALF